MYRSSALSLIQAVVAFSPNVSNPHALLCAAIVLIAVSIYAGCCDVCCSRLFSSLQLDLIRPCAVCDAPDQGLSAAAGVNRWFHLCHGASVDWPLDAELVACLGVCVVLLWSLAPLRAFCVGLSSEPACACSASRWSLSLLGSHAGAFRFVCCVCGQVSALYLTIATSGAVDPFVPHISTLIEVCAVSTPLPALTALAAFTWRLLLCLRVASIGRAFVYAMIRGPVRDCFRVGVFSVRLRI